MTVLTLSLLLVGCGGTKKVQTTPKPQWVNNRPSSSIFYYGIGAAPKTTDISQYQQAARQNALADMAAEISVNISSNSVIHAFESNLNFREDFTSTIRAQTQQELEGYELVDTWDDVGNYWVFYRLSKPLHQELKERRKQDAIARSLDFFTDAITVRQAGNIKLSLVQMAKALEPIKPYFNETLPAIIDGKEVYLGNEIFKEISYTIAKISIVPNYMQLNAKIGQPIHSNQLTFRATFNESTGIADLPLVAEYSEKPIRNNTQRTASSGAASFDVDIVRSNRSMETFTAKMDLQDILVEAGTDAITRRLLNRFNLPSGSIRIQMEKPSLHIVVEERIFGTPQEQSLLEQSIMKKALEMGYGISSTIEESDYVVRAISNSERIGRSGQYFVVAVKGSITLESSNGKALYHKTLDGIEARHLDLLKASEEAYKEVQRKVDITYFREMHEAITRM